MTLSHPDVVIVGAGIAGSALAFRLAQHKLSVVMLEKSLQHVDRVRGEFIVPWGVAEARELGLLDILEQAGGNYTSRSIPYGEGAAPDKAHERAMRMDQIVPDVKGAFNLGHPAICDTLNRAATGAGAVLLRGVEDIEISPGERPAIGFSHLGERIELRPRLVVGADGRNSMVARTRGFTRTADPIHHFLTGMLVENAHGWPDTDQSLGVDGDLSFYVFPQGGGRIRLYAGYPLEQKSRFAGASGPANFIAAFGRDCFPKDIRLGDATPAGPCHGYPNNESHIEMPAIAGVLLIGDAAGHSDPSGGQGISVSLRDARLVSECLIENPTWTSAIFAEYLANKRELARRIAFANRLLATFRMEFTEDARHRRIRGYKRMLSEPDLLLPFVALQKGPFAMPAEAFESRIAERLLA